jgi:hypothetical protein
LVSFRSLEKALGFGSTLKLKGGRVSLDHCELPVFVMSFTASAKSNQGLNLVISIFTGSKEG